MLFLENVNKYIIIDVAENDIFLVVTHQNLRSDTLQHESS